MNKLLMALAITLSVGYSAEAQKKTSCPTGWEEGARSYNTTKSGQNTAKNQYAQNFKVCKDDYGYTICGQRRTAYNSTPHIYTQAVPSSYVRNYNTYLNVEDRNTSYLPAEDFVAYHQPLLAPESQSYPPANINLSTSASYQGYYPGKGHIKVSYDNGTAPYEAKQSPQYDGPEKNQARNLKVNSPEQVSGDPAISLPPPSGEIKKYK